MNSGTIPKKRIGVDPIKSCDCECRCGCDDAASSREPVRLFNGQKEFSVADLSSGALGAVWGHTRQYNNRLKDGDSPVSFDMGQGYNWLIAQWPYAYENDSDGSYQVVRGSENAFFFEPIGGGEFSPWFGIHQKLEHDTAAGRLRMTDPDGHVWELNDFESLEAPGLFRKMTTPGGQTVEVTAYHEDKIATVERSSSSEAALEQYQYDYLEGGDGESRLETVTLRRRPDDVSPWQDVRRVVYTYYADGDDHGSEGDLQTAVHEAWIGGTWTATATHYYRYWKDSEGNGFQHALKYAVGPEAYQRLEQAVGDPLLAADGVVAQYADLYLEYDAEQRVTKEIVAGGSRAYLFTFDDRPEPYSHGYNHWVRETSETRPDGTQNIVFTNHIGQVLLRELTDGAGNRWIEHWRYDEEEAHTVLHAHPSSIDSYTFDTAGELSVSLKDNEGLIEVTDYYTTTGSGAAEGRVLHEKLKQGESGTPINLRSYEYTSHSEGDRTVHLVSKETVYRNEDGSGAVDTTYSYTWHSGTVQLQQRVTTLPAVPTSQNGSGISNSRSERFDDEGNLTWAKDERGFLHRNQYDPATGSLIQTIQDVDTAQVSDAPTGWSTPSGGGKHIISDFEHDDLGRITQELGPEHEVDISGVATPVRTATWTIYDDANNEVRTAQGYVDQVSSLDRLVNPVSITKLDHAGRTTQEIQATRASLTSGKLQQSDTFAQSSYVRWTTNSFDDEGRLQHTRVYHTIPSSGAGSSGINYDQTDYGYDSMNRQNMVRSPGGTITRTVFSAVGWDSVPTAIYIGTNDTGATQSDPTGPDPNNMVLVTEYEYDNANDSGDSLLTKQTDHVDAFTNRETSFLYDWRTRQTDVNGEEDFYQVSVFDNLDRVTRVDRHNTTSTGSLIARSETKFDDLGRVYQTKRYAVNVATGTVGNSLTDNTWYDEAGNVLKEHPAGSEAFTKYEYDSLGRQVKQFIGFDVSESTYAEAFDVVGDTIFEQSETDYDDASNVIETRLRRRHHDATGTGELTTPGGSNPKARVSYTAFYADAVGRQIAVANHGTNDDTALSRSSTIPIRSDDILVTTTEYNDDGEPYKTIDPAGKEDLTEFDDAGRVTRQIENYTDGDPTTGGNDEDITVCFTYTPDGHQATITAKQKSSSDDQTTQYIYGTSLSDSDISRTDLLRAVIYPDSDDTCSTGVPPVLGNGPDGIYDRVEHKYNRQGELKETKDQNGTVHAFDYDKLGRQLHDRVITLGTNIDGAARRISTTYEVRGQLERISSYDNPTGGNVVNEVLREYNDAGLLEKEYQEHDGAKDANTLYVGYNYDESASGGEFTKGLRPQSVRYTNGRLVHYTYGSSGSDADNLNRLDAIKDDNSGSPGDTLASYTYLGLGQMVIEDLAEPKVRLDYFGGTSGTYAGFDRFNRIIDQRWYDYGASEDRDRFKYGYDRASNRTWKENVVSKNLGTPVYLDELYSYDGVNRLTNMDRGQLNATKTGITGTPSREEDWTLDPLGNWSNYIQKTSGITDLDQDRTVNKANEITDITESTGTSWATPAHDRAGNMTCIPQPDDLATNFDLTWDAWNRIVKVEDYTAIVAEYSYDGLTRRATKDFESIVHHFFFTFGWQIVEERLDSSPNAGIQFIWGPLYIDHIILRDRDTSAPPNGTLDERVYPCQDANWNVGTLIDGNGNALERIVYESYGLLTIYNADWSATLTTSQFRNSYSFTGREQEADSNLHLFRMRTYHALLGHFLSRDPFAYDGGWNLLRYVDSNPHSIRDPLGLLPQNWELWLVRMVCGTFADEVIRAHVISKNPGIEIRGNIEIQTIVEWIIKGLIGRIRLRPDIIIKDPTRPGVATIYEIKSEREKAGTITTQLKSYIETLAGQGITTELGCCQHPGTSIGLAKVPWCGTIMWMCTKHEPGVIRYRWMTGPLKIPVLEFEPELVPKPVPIAPPDPIPFVPPVPIRPFAPPRPVPRPGLSPAPGAPSIFLSPLPVWAWPGFWERLEKQQYPYGRPA